MKKILSCFIWMGMCFVTLTGYAQANNACGAGNWVSTGVKGPFGYHWYYSQDRSVGSAAAVKHICGHFYSQTQNCNKIPASQGGYTYDRCAYNAGIYTLNASKGEQKITAICQNC